MKNSITLEQIASKIGISRTTIYKVLNNKGNVSPETKTKILTALDEYNYTPISSVAPAVPKEPPIPSSISGCIMSATTISRHWPAGASRNPMKNTKARACE